MTSSYARRMKRAQARDMARSPDFAKAVGSLKGLRPAIDDTQTAVVQVLQELDRFEYQMNRQRAIYLRMVMEMKGAYRSKSFIITNEAVQTGSDPVESVLALEEQYGLEYDTIFSIARGLMIRQQAEEAENSPKEGP